jgi:hypothetical protein
MIKKIFYFITILTLENCKLFTGASTYYLTGTNYKVPDGTPAFQQGFRDGCESGLHSRGNVLYRTRYSHKYTPSLIDNPEYKFGYGRGYGWCFTTQTAGGHTGGFDAFIYGKGVPFDMGRASIDGTVQYETGSWSNPLNTNAGGVDGIIGAVQSPKGFSTFGTHPLYGTKNDTQIFVW